MPRAVSALDARILEALSERGRIYLDLDQDREWLAEIVSNPSSQIAGMKQRGILEPVTAGRYVALLPGQAQDSSELPLGIFLAALFGDHDNYYLGYLSAIVEHRLTDDHSQTIYIAVFGSGPRVKELGGRSVNITHLHSRRKQFGAERVRALGRAFYRRSNLERTLLDTLDRPALCGAPETWVRAWERARFSETLDLARLVEYASDWGGTVGARAAFWLGELGEVRAARTIHRAIGAPLSGPRVLDASRSFGEGHHWPRDRNTGLVFNMPPEAIEGWLSYGK